MQRLHRRKLSDVFNTYYIIDSNIKNPSFAGFIDKMMVFFSNDGDICLIGYESHDIVYVDSKDFGNINDFINIEMQKVLFFGKSSDCLLLESKNGKIDVKRINFPCFSYIYRENKSKVIISGCVYSINPYSLDICKIDDEQLASKVDLAYQIAQNSHPDYVLCRNNIVLDHKRTSIYADNSLEKPFCTLDIPIKDIIHIADYFVLLHVNNTLSSIPKSGNAIPQYHDIDDKLLSITSLNISNFFICLSQSKKMILCRMGSTLEHHTLPSLFKYTTLSISPISDTSFISFNENGVILVLQSQPNWWDSIYQQVSVYK